MNKADHSNTVALAKVHAGRLRERNSDLLALMYGAQALLEAGDSVNGLTLLQIAIDHTGSIVFFQDLAGALNQLEAQ